MRRLRVTMAMVVAAGGVFLSYPAAANAQGLNDVLIRLLSGAGGGANCPGLAGSALVGPLNDFCRPAGGGGVGAASSAGAASPTIENRLGESEEQRRQAQRLAERRAGLGGSADQPGTGFGVFVN